MDTEDEFFDADTLLKAVDEAAGDATPMPAAQDEDDAIRRARELPRARAFVREVREGGG